MHQAVLASNAHEAPLVMRDVRLLRTTEGAERVLDEFATVMPFPYERYRYHSIRAVVAAQKGHASDAKEEAGLALVAAAATHSGFRYHPNLGLVGDARDGRCLRARSSLSHWSRYSTGSVKRCMVSRERMVGSVNGGFPFPGTSPRARSHA
jgi:hypothetical protein